MAAVDNEILQKYLDYFAEDLAAVKDEIAKSRQYSNIIDTEIEHLRENLLNRGTQKYLVDHLENAISLQSQRQNLNKDLFTIKKTIMDYAFKDAKIGDDGKKEVDIITALDRLIKESEDNRNKIEKLTVTTKSDAEIDKEIDEGLA